MRSATFVRAGRSVAYGAVMGLSHFFRASLYLKIISSPWKQIYRIHVSLDRTMEVPRRLAFAFSSHANILQRKHRKVRVSLQKRAWKRTNAMKRFGIMMATAALGAALVASGPAAAFRGGGGTARSGGGSMAAAAAGTVPWRRLARGRLARWRLARRRLARWLEPRRLARGWNRGWNRVGWNRGWNRGYGWNNGSLEQWMGMGRPWTWSRLGRPGVPL